jgi:hypothetical protein
LSGGGGGGVVAGAWLEPHAATNRINARLLRMRVAIAQPFRVAGRRSIESDRADAHDLVA